MKNKVIIENKELKNNERINKSRIMKENN